MRAVVVMPRARRQIDRAAEWWISHRDKAPEAFYEDLEEALHAIAENAGTGVIVRRGHLIVRRLLLPRIRYYLYYRLRDEIVEVILVWHASRREPRF